MRIEIAEWGGTKNAREERIARRWRRVKEGLKLQIENAREERIGRGWRRGEEGLNRRLKTHGRSGWERRWKWESGLKSQIDKAAQEDTERAMDGGAERAHQPPPQPPPPPKPPPHHSPTWGIHGAREPCPTTPQKWESPLESIHCWQRGSEGGEAPESRGVWPGDAGCVCGQGPAGLSFLPLGERSVRCPCALGERTVEVKHTLGERNCEGTGTCCFPLLFPCCCFPPLQSTAVCNFNQVFPQFFRQFFRQFFWQFFCEHTRAWPSETPRSIVAKNLASYDMHPDSSIKLFPLRLPCALST